MRHLKEEFDKLTLKELIILFLSIACMAAAVIAVFLGMYLPPQGEVHTSVLTYFGISAAFAGALLGISVHYSAELDRFKTRIEQMISSLTEGKEAENGTV